MNLLIDFICSHRWAITRDALESIVALVKRDNATPLPGAITTKDGEPLEGTRKAELIGNVAIIPVTGTIFPRGNYWYSGTSINSLAKDFAAAIENPSVSAIVLNIDSPGGEITGVSEFANLVYQARGKKPIVAYVYGLGASAAYWIASAADKIVVADTAEVGSIGVVSAYTDFTEWDKKNGIKEIEIVSSQSPKKRLSPATDAGAKEVQTVVDDLADVFINAVARHRKVTFDKVVDSFGQGGVMVAARALEAGMIDEIGSLEIVLSNFNTQQSLPGGSFMDINELMAKHPNTYSAVLEIGKKEGKSTAQADIDNAVKSATEKERTRITGILSLNGIAGANKLIEENLMKPEATKETVALLILEAQKIATQKVQTAVAADSQDLASQIQQIETNAPPQGNEQAKELEVGKAIAKLADGITV